jgi:branched-chain amino acid transport system substrate-binding protein
MARLPVQLLAALLAIAGAAPAAATVLIGAAGPAEGPNGATGAQITRGAKLAADRINSEGGVQGEPVEVVEADDGCAEREAEAAARALVARGVALVVGHPCARAAIAAAKVYAEAGIVFIAPATRHPALTAPRAGPMVFRLAGRDDGQGATAGAYLARAFASKPVAVVRDGSLYAKKLAEDAVAALKAAGRGDVLTATIEGGRKDYTGLVAKLAAARTQAIFFTGFPIEGALLLRQIRAAELGTVFLGGDALATPQFVEMAGAEAAGAGALLPHDAARALTDEVLGETFKSRKPTETLVLAYAAVEAWRAAVAQAQSLSATAAGAALQQGAFETVLGPVSFDEQGDADAPSYDIVWWNDGAWRPKD